LEHLERIDTTHLVLVLILIKEGRRTKYTGYNPRADVEPNQTVWLYSQEPLQQFQWDPAEWKWGALPGMKEAPFFQYDVKRGYKIGIIQTHVPMIYQETLILSKKGQNSI
jgi:hypothetical protein